MPPVSRRTFREKVLDRKLLTIGTRFPGPPEGRAYDSEPEFTRKNFYTSRLRAQKGYLQWHTVATPFNSENFSGKVLGRKRLRLGTLSGISRGRGFSIWNRSSWQGRYLAGRKLRPFPRGGNQSRPTRTGRLRASGRVRFLGGAALPWTPL